jgi:hypothetical protein
MPAKRESVHRHTPIPQLHHDEVRGVDVEHLRCAECRAWLGLGESNDRSDAVAVEIRAAEIASSRCGDDGWFRETGEAVGSYDNWAGNDNSGEICQDWLAGWLSGELTSHDQRETRYPGAWSWDPNRPLAEQWTDPALQELLGDDPMQPVDRAEPTAVDRALADRLAVDGRSGAEQPRPLPENCPRCTERDHEEDTLRTRLGDAQARIADLEAENRTLGSTAGVLVGLIVQNGGP